MADSGNAKVSHAAEPSDQTAAIASVSVTGEGPQRQTVYAYTANGTLDSLFSDTVDLPAFNLYRGILITVAGNLKWQDKDGNTCGPAAFAVGVYPIRPRRIFATGTTATTIFGLR